MNDQNASARLFRSHMDSVQRDANQLFFWLLLSQWLFGIVLASIVSPYAWAGRTRTLHTHVWMAVLLGAALNSLPLLMLRKAPQAPATKHVVAVAQMMWSALLIDLSGGRIETHFHVFGSLAFLAFYRDFGVLTTATLVVSSDHFVRGLLWPDALYGVSNPEWWRFMEHASWVLFEVTVLALGTSRARRDMRQLADQTAALEQTHARVEETVALRTQQLGDSLDRYRTLVENTNAIPWIIEPTSSTLLYIAPQAMKLFGCSADDLSTQRLMDLIHPDDRARTEEHFALARTGHANSGDPIDYRMITFDHRLIHVRTSVGALVPGKSLSGITLDISKQTKLEGELRQAQKLESVGKLAAGVAHEINTPVQFVSDSLHFVQSACGDLCALVARYRSADNDNDAERFAKQIDLPYLERQLPRAIELALEGLGRVTGIVRSMKEFAYPHTSAMVDVDLNQAIRSTLTIARAEYKYVADVETHFADLPRVRCHVGDINQVVLNLVVNAAHAIAAKSSGERGTIVVRTELAGEDVVVSVTDSGGGIADHLRERIFDPFFTTKDVGRGTGQGLAISRTIVVDRHRGALWYETELSVGSTFYVKLPLAGEQREEPAA